MKRYINYLKTVLRHRWWVFIYCRQLGVTWLGIIHDLSKLSKAEFRPYAINFFCADGSKAVHVPGYHPNIRFKYAWLHHIHHNPHHWEYWVSYDKGEPRAQVMPDKYVREMVADWKAAGKIYSGKEDAANWYQKNKCNMVLHWNTHKAIMQLLCPEKPLTTFRHVAVLAGSYAQYDQYVKDHVGVTDTKYLQVVDSDNWRGRELHEYVVIGNFWQAQPDAGRIYDEIRQRVAETR